MATENEFKLILSLLEQMRAESAAERAMGRAEMAEMRRDLNSALVRFEGVRSKLGAYAAVVAVVATAFTQWAANHFFR